MSEAPASLVPTQRPPADEAAVDVVYILHTASWQAAWRRGLYMPEDRLVTSLLKSERVDRLLVCNHARSLPLKLLRAAIGSDRHAPFPRNSRTHLLEPLRWRRSDPSGAAALDRSAAAYDRTVSRAVRRHGLRDPVAIVAHPLIAGLARLDWAREVTWYATDDWANHPGYSRWRDGYRESYARIRASARRVAAVSSVLLERIAPSGPSLVVPNGLDPAEWSGPAPEAPEAFIDRTGPLFVYVGTLDTRLDIGWIETVAQDRPESTIALVGPVVDGQHVSPLERLGNVKFHPPVSRRALTGLLRSADVGLLPHRRTPLTVAMSPLKVLEYLAAGLPVAATDLPPVREFGHPRVLLVPDDSDYAAAVDAALALGRAAEAERLAFVEANSWRSRHERLLELAIG